MRGIRRSPVNSPHKRPVTRKMFPFDDVIMSYHVSKARTQEDKLNSHLVEHVRRRQDNISQCIDNGLNATHERIVSLGGAWFRYMISQSQTHLSQWPACWPFGRDPSVKKRFGTGWTVSRWEREWFTIGLLTPVCKVLIEMSVFIRVMAWH